MVASCVLGLACRVWPQMAAATTGTDDGMGAATGVVTGRPDNDNGSEDDREDNDVDVDVDGCVVGDDGCDTDDDR